MESKKMKRRLWSLVLAVAALLMIAPSAALASTPPSVTLGEASLSGTTCTFPNAQVAGDVNTLTVSLTGAGKINSTTTPDMQDTTATSMTFTFSVSSQNNATSILQALSFSDCRRTTKIEVTADANQTTELPSGATLTKLGDHYYMYVPGKLSWSKAYNKAKTYKYNGMQGYLATITSDDEYEAIHERAGSQSGWIGGTLMLKSDYSKINDDAELVQSEGAFVYKADAAYDNTKAKAIADYYWACGPEAGESITVDTHSNSEPNAYQHTGSDQPWSGMDNTLGMTTYECCLTANNEGSWVINDITESGYSASGYADGYFVEFGGYAEGADPGNPDASKTSTAAYTFTHEHILTYAASGNVLTVTCSNEDGLCDLPTGGLTLTLSSGAAEYCGVVEVIGTAEEREAWTSAWFNLPAVTYEYSETETGTYSVVDRVRNAGYYVIKASAGGATAQANLNISKKVVDPYIDSVGYVVSGKVYDGTTELVIGPAEEWYIEDKVPGDDLSVTGIGRFENADVEEGKEIDIISVQLSGNDACNYICNFTEDWAYADITARKVTLTWGNTELAYTGEEQAPSCTLGNLVDGEEVGLNVGGAQTAVGKGYTATASLTGDAAVISNYKLPENSSVSFSISKTAITPSVSIDGWTYGDEAGKPAVADATNPGKGSVTYEYSKKGEDSWSADVPTDAGEYTVRSTVAETDFYKGGTATADFIIAPKSIEGAKVVLGEGLVANGEEQEQAVESVVLADGTTLAATSYVLSGNKVTAAGSYKLTVAGTGNYTGAVEVAFTVAENPDEVAANEVIDKINAIGKVDDSEASKQAIEAARKAYDALTDEQKKLVGPEALKKLEDAEAAYKQAKAEAEERARKEAEEKAKKEAEDKAKQEADAKDKEKKLPATGDIFTCLAQGVAATGVTAAAAGLLFRRRDNK